MGYKTIALPTELSRLQMHYAFLSAGKPAPNIRLILLDRRNLYTRILLAVALLTVAVTLLLIADDSNLRTCCKTDILCRNLYACEVWGADFCVAVRFSKEYLVE